MQEMAMIIVYWQKNLITGGFGLAKLGGGNTNSPKLLCY